MAAPLNLVTLTVPTLPNVLVSSINYKTPCDQGTIVSAFPLDVAGTLCSVFLLRSLNGFSGSRLFLDYMARTLMKTQVLTDLKTYVACCIQALIQVGIPAETLWTFIAANYGVQPPATCFADASNHKVLTYINITNTPLQIKANLIAGFTCIVGITVYSSWSSDPKVMGTGAGDGTGLIYQNAGDTVVKNMMVNIWGWDDRTLIWYAQACWGNQGSSGGNFLIPYTYLSNVSNVVTDIWSLQAVSTGPPVPCGVGAWNGTWSSCNTATGALAPCGTVGIQTQTRTNVPPTNGGTACPPASQTQSCTAAACPQDCTVTEWGNAVCTPPASWPTTKQCGWTGGTETLTRAMVLPQTSTGAACPPLTLTLANTCDGPSCPGTDCVVGAWSAYGICDAKDCGTIGKETSTRTVTTQPVNGGQACPALTQTVPCDAPHCNAVDCRVSDWSDWGQCSSKACGTPGTRTKSMKVITPASNGGQACPTLTTTKVCNPMCTSQIAVAVLIFVMILLMALGVALAFW